jgi:glucose-1-phosphate thymidylyltransferase
MEFDADKLKGIILHGGAGTRLRPLTFTGPKQLIPVANKPISQYVLEDLVEAGISEIAIVLGNIYPEKVKEYYGDGSRFGAKITYVYQGEPKGIAHAVKLCEDFVGDDKFVVYLGDNLIKGGIANFTEKFSKNKELDAMILLTQVKDPSRFGVARFDSSGRIVGLIEKPKDPPSNFALAGIYFFSPLIFEMISELKPSWRGELEITEAIQMLFDKGANVIHDIIKGWWKDTGKAEDIIEANRLLLDELKSALYGTVEDDASIQGRILIGKGSIVRKGALIRGPVVVGENTTIESSVYLGPYTSVGSDCKIRSGEIENSIIMDGCEIDVDDRIVDSLIGAGSRIASAKGNIPRGRSFILGESSSILL